MSSTENSLVNNNESIAFQVFVKKRSTKWLILFLPFSNRNLLKSFSLEDSMTEGYGVGGASPHRHVLHSGSWHASKIHFTMHFMLACLLLFNFFKLRWPRYRGYRYLDTPFPPSAGKLKRSWSRTGYFPVGNRNHELAVKNSHFPVYRSPVKFGHNFQIATSRFLLSHYKIILVY